MVVFSSELAVDVLASVERAAGALGRLCVAVEPGGPALLDALTRRQALAAVGGGEEGARALLLGDVRPEYGMLLRHDAVLRSAPANDESGYESLRLALTVSELEGVVSNSVEATLRAVFSAEQKFPPITRAAIVAGAIIASSPASRDAPRAAALSADLVLRSAQLVPASFGAPAQLDAATRSAAVQLERSGAWPDWVRAWCSLAARDAGATERAVRTTLGRFAAEQAGASAQHRIGATDRVVLGRVHATSTFTIRDASAALGLSAPTVGTAIERLEALGFATELTGQKRDRVWTSTALLELTVGRAGAISA